MGKVMVVVGGQYGSEAKGHVAAYLGRRDAVTIGVRVAGPNAGHTVIGPDAMGHPEVNPGWEGPAREWKLRTIPVLAVSNPMSPLVIAAGSEIDPQVLDAEITELDKAGYRVSQRLLIDSQATLIEPGHIEVEQQRAMQSRIGSTAKGIGAARSARVMREASTWGGSTEAETMGQTLDTTNWLRGALALDASVIIEGTQGYGLGLHAGEYPFCTSSDCRAIDFLAMAGLSPWDPVIEKVEPWVVLRTRPIRVAGNSGRLENETTWEGLGLPEERTTVTNKVRRVGEWDHDLARRAVVANGGPNVRVAITMLDQMFPEVAGARTFEDLSVQAVEWVAQKQFEIGAPVHLVGTSPSTIVDIEGRI